MKCEAVTILNDVFFVLVYGSSTLSIVYPLTLPLCVKKFCISGTACSPRGQVPGGGCFVFNRTRCSAVRTTGIKETGRSE